MAAAGAIAAWRSPVRTLLCLYAAVVPFGSGITLPVPLPPPFNTVTTLLGVFAAVGVAAAIAVGRAGASRLPATVPVALLLLAASAVTYGWSVNREATGDGVLVLGSLVGLYVVVLLAGMREGDAVRLGDAIAGGGAVASAYGFYLLLTDSLPAEAAGVARFATAGGVGDDSDPNITAATLVLPLVLAWDRVLDRRGVERLVWVAGASTITVGILLTGSRGGLAGAAVALLVLAAVRVGPVRALAAVAVGAALFYAVGLALAPDQTERLSRPGSSGRTNVWELGLAACDDHCLTGAGLSTYLDVHEERFLTESSAEGFRASLKAHNIWLQAGVETGLLGFGLLALLFWSTYRGLRRLPRARRGPPVAGLVGLLVTNAFLGNVAFKYFWLVLIYAGVMAVAEPAGSATPMRLSWPWRTVPALRSQWRPALAAGAVVAVAVAAGTSRLADPPQYRAEALVVASRTADTDQIDVADLVDAVFLGSGLDAVAEVATRREAIAFPVTASAGTPAVAARTATTAAGDLVRAFNRVSNFESELRLVDEAHPALATVAGGAPGTIVRMGASLAAGIAAAAVVGVVLAFVRRPIVSERAAADVAGAPVVAVGSADTDGATIGDAVLARLPEARGSIAVDVVGRRAAGIAMRLRSWIGAPGDAAGAVVVVAEGAPRRALAEAARRWGPDGVRGVVLVRPRPDR